MPPTVTELRTERLELRRFVPEALADQDFILELLNQRSFVDNIADRGVRTRADADTVEARASDTTRRDAAFASGAQIVSTDFERVDPRWPTYVVALPGGGEARCNPISAPKGCAL